jgi:hypothetical protein
MRELDTTHPIKTEVLTLSSMFHSKPHSNATRFEGPSKDGKTSIRSLVGFENGAVASLGGRVPSTDM